MMLKLTIDKNKTLYAFFTRRLETVSVLGILAPSDKLFQALPV